MRSIISSILIVSIFLTGSANAQDPSANDILVSGKVIEQETNRPLSYVSIGIPDKPFGTLSDSLGRFVLHVPQENLSDSLQVSLVGYFSRRIAIKDIVAGKELSIALRVQYVELAEVVVTDKKTNMETIGRQASGKFVQVSIHNKKSVSETIGSEMGMRYKASKGNATLKDFNFNISANNFNSIKYRVNVYAVKDNMPDTLLYHSQIFTTVDHFRTGWISVDLEPYHINLPKDFIVSLQWVDSRMDHKEDPVTMIPVAVSLFSKNCYVRVAALDKWQKKAMNLSNYVTVMY